MIILKQMLLGPLDNFIYFVGDADTKEIAVVDPAWDVDFLLREAEKNDLRITKIFLTHGHPDHVNGIGDLQKTHDVPVFMCNKEAPFYVPKCRNLEMLADGATVRVGAVEFSVIHTPGHSPGCICYKSGDTLIAGDLIFIDGCGRCDLPGGDPAVMYDSLYNVLMKLPDSTMIYPGHNYGDRPSATLGELKKTNPYLTCGSKDEFLRTRMGY